MLMMMNRKNSYQGSPLQLVKETQHYPQQTNVLQWTCH